MIYGVFFSVNNSYENYSYEIFIINVYFDRSLVNKNQIFYYIFNRKSKSPPRMRSDQIKNCKDKFY